MLKSPVNLKACPYSRKLLYRQCASLFPQMNSFGRIVFQIIIHSFIHLLASEYILNNCICQTLCKALRIHSEQMDKHPYLHVAHILRGG